MLLELLQIASHLRFNQTFYSAGVGRTGTFIALDKLLQQPHDEVFDVVRKMRLQRTEMVQTQVCSLSKFFKKFYSSKAFRSFRFLDSKFFMSKYGSTNISID